MSRAVFMSVSGKIKHRRSVKVEPKIEPSCTVSVSRCRAKVAKALLAVAVAAGLTSLAL